MHDQIYSLWDISQLVLTVWTCWFCYRCGRNTGIRLALSGMVVVTNKEEDEEEVDKDVDSGK